jgi:hypothetical protein
MRMSGGGGQNNLALCFGGLAFDKLFTSIPEKALIMVKNTGASIAVFAFWFRLLSKF